MANESTTKPTYSELEAENLRVRGLLQRTQGRMIEQIRVLLKWAAEMWAKDKPELASESDNKARFLMQFMPEMNTSLFDEEWAAIRKEQDAHWLRLNPDPPNFPQSSSLVSQGAESADIGKLDAADKSGAHTSLRQKAHEDLATPFEQEYFGLGSAETGGEKAAPHQQTIFVVTGEYSQSAYFNRASAERHIAERKEPGRYQIHEYKLAESSLSSPPQNSDSSAPNVPELTGLSGEQAEARTAKETR